MLNDFIQAPYQVITFASVGFFGKIIGTIIPALYYQIPLRDAFTLGFILTALGTYDLTTYGDALAREMDHQEQFLHDQVRFIQQTLEEKEDHFEHLLQEDRARRIPPAKDSMTEEERKDREIKVNEVLRYHAKHVIHFDEGKDKLIEIYEEKKAEIKRKYMEELLAMEMELESSLSRLMDILAPPHFDKEDTG